MKAYHFLIPIIVLFFSSCATIGDNFDFHGPNEFKIGHTSKQDILKRFGTPFRIGYDSGDLQWTYAYYHYSLFYEGHTKDLVIIFDKSGMVKRYVFNTSGQKEKEKIMLK